MVIGQRPSRQAQPGAAPAARPAGTPAPKGLPSKCQMPLQATTAQTGPNAPLWLGDGRLCSEAGEQGRRKKGDGLFSERSLLASLLAPNKGASPLLYIKLEEARVDLLPLIRIQNFFLFTWAKFIQHFTQFVQRPVGPFIKCPTATG